MMTEISPHIPQPIKERRKRGRCVFIPESLFPVSGRGGAGGEGRGGGKIYFYVKHADPVSDFVLNFLELCTLQNDLLSQFCL